MSIAPGDYISITSQPVTFSSAPSQMCIPVSILNDNVVEANKLFTVTLESSDPAVQFTLSFASVTIIDSSGKYLLCVCSPAIYHPASYKLAHIIVTYLNNSVS